MGGTQTHGLLHLMLTWSDGWTQTHVAWFPLRGIRRLASPWASSTLCAPSPIWIQCSGASWLIPTVQCFGRSAEALLNASRLAVGVLLRMASSMRSSCRWSSGAADVATCVVRSHRHVATVWSSSRSRLPSQARRYGTSLRRSLVAGSRRAPSGTRFAGRPGGHPTAMRCIAPRLCAALQRQVT